MYLRPEIDGRTNRELTQRSSRAKPNAHDRKNTNSATNPAKTASPIVAELRIKRAKPDTACAPTGEGSTTGPGAVQTSRKKRPSKIHGYVRGTTSPQNTIVRSNALT